MNQDNFKQILTEALSPILDRLDDPDTGLVAINNKLAANTSSIVELESTVKSYADAYKINKANIERLDDRLKPLEDHAGIIPQPELAIQR